MTAKKNPILVVAEVGEGHVRPVTFELVTAARQIRDGEKGPLAKILILVPAQEPMEVAREIAGITGLTTMAIHWPCEVTPESMSQGLSHLLEKLNPSFLLFAHTTLGREVAPGLGARHRACTISGVIEIRPDRDGLVFLRPIMDNDRVLLVRPAVSPFTILTLVPGAFGTADGQPHDNIADPGNRVIEAKLPGTCLSPAIQRKSMTRRVKGSQALKEARVVVAAGRGIGDQENLEKIEAFSKVFPNSCVGASRPLVDQGWISYSRQVGITGAVVAPDLYIACGISGSSQHLAGMGGAKWVVSINTNPHAPICRHSDLCIQGDLIEFIDAFLEEK